MQFDYAPGCYFSDVTLEKSRSWNNHLHCFAFWYHLCNVLDMNDWFVQCMEKAENIAKISNKLNEQTIKQNCYATMFCSLLSSPPSGSCDKYKEVQD